VTKFVDLATCGLINACNQATNLPTVKVTVGQNDAGDVIPFMVYTLTNALVSSISAGGGGGGKPQETVTFNYTKIEWAYAQQGPDVKKTGNNSAVWNLASNAAA